MSILTVVGRLITACGGTTLNPLIANEIHKGAVEQTGEPVAYDTLSSYVKEGGTRFIRVQLPTGRTELRLYVERTTDRKNPYVIGSLKRHFPETPVQMAFFEYLGVRFITGMIDEGIQGTLDHIGFHHETPNRKFSLNARKLGAIHRDNAFLIPIFANEFRNWQFVQEVNIDTAEYIKEVSKSGYFDHPFQRQYNPPINIDRQFVQVPSVISPQ